MGINWKLEVMCFYLNILFGQANNEFNLKFKKVNNLMT